MSPRAKMSTNTLTASYASPSSTIVFSSSLPSLPSDPNAQDIPQKTTYLCTLRSNVIQMQSDINVFLTQKMEEDKAAESGADGKGKAQEEKAEEMYGEEDPEDDA